MSYAIVKFKNSDARYTYLTDVKGLVEGNKVWVEAKGELKKARFVTYVPEQYLTVRPQARLTGKRFDEVKSEETSVKHTKRSNAQIDTEAVKLYKFLESSAPTAKTSAEIADYMGEHWTEKNTSSYIKVSMRRIKEMKVKGSIISYDHNLYTIRRSNQEKYQLKMEA